MLKTSIRRRELLKLTAAGLAGGAPGLLEAATLDDMIGQMLMMGTLGASANDEWPRRLATQVTHGRMGGVVLLGHNFKSREGVLGITRLLRRAQGRRPLFIALDQEGGKVQRLGPKLGYDSIPAARELARSATPERAKAIYAAMAKLVKAAGFNMNLGPVVDLGIEPSNPVVGLTGRTYGNDARSVVPYATAFVEAHRAQGVLTVLKHFPGHGSSKSDSHDSFVDITQTWKPDELEPFKMMIHSDRVDAIMPGHLLHKTLAGDGDPVSISSAAIHDLLRKQLGFNGLVISDDLQMAAVRNRYSLEDALARAINAGVDMLMVTNSASPDPELPRKLIERVKGLVASGAVPEARIKSAYQRIIKAKARVA